MSNDRRIFSRLVATELAPEFFESVSGGTEGGVDPFDNPGEGGGVRATTKCIVDDMDANQCRLVLDD